MGDHDRREGKWQPYGSCWVSFNRIALIAFVAIAGRSLAYEHRQSLHDRRSRAPDGTIDTSDGL